MLLVVFVENPVVKRVDSSKPVLAQRHVLGDLSNKTSREKENRQVCTCVCMYYSVLLCVYKTS